MGAYLVHHPLHNFSPELGSGCLHGNGRLQGTLQYNQPICYRVNDDSHLERLDPKRLPATGS